MDVGKLMLRRYQKFKAQLQRDQQAVPDTGEILTWEERKARAEKIYAPLKERLEKEHFGKACAVEVHSGDYFIGKLGIDVLKKGQKKHPKGTFFVFRIGRRTYGKIPSARRRHL